MGPVVVDEDSVRVGGGSAEESNSNNSSSSHSVGSSVADSLKSTAKSAVQLFPPSLCGSKYQGAEGENPPASDEGTNSHAEMEGRADEVMAESTPGDTITDVRVEGRSVVDRFEGEDEDEEAINDQAQSVSNSKSGQGVEETPESGDRLSMQAHSFVSNVATERKIFEEDCHTAISRSGYIADSPLVPSSSLRRRPRSSSKGRKDGASARSSVGARISKFSESIDIAAIAERPVAFEPRNDPLAGAPEDTEEDASVVSFVGAQVSRFSESIDIAAIAESPNAFEPQHDSLSGAFGDTEAESQLLNDVADSVSKVDSVIDLKEFRSEYLSDVEEDHNDISATSSSEAKDGVDMWKRRRSQPEERWREVASSSDLKEKASIPETRQRREVYRMPGSDAEREDNGGDHPPQTLPQPAGFVVRSIEFQLNLIVHMLAIGIWLANFTLSTLAHPISRTVEVGDKVTSVTASAANQVLEVFSQTGPTLSKLSMKTFWGCLGVAYVICMLGLLLIPALLLNIIVVNSTVEKPLVIRQALDFDFTQPRPVALLSLFPAKEIDRIKNLPVDKVVKTRVISAGSKFRVMVFMTLPESDYNMKLGMFQVTAELLSARDQVILRSSKPCRLRYKSFLIQLVKSLAFAVPHLVGLSKEAETIEIRLLEAQEKATPTASVRILIEPKASFRGEGGVPEIYEASVRLESILPWPRAIISRWKWLFFLWNLVCLFLSEVAIVLCCCRKVLIPSFGSNSVAEDEIVEGEVKDESATREVPRDMRSSRKRRTSRRVYFEDNIPGAESSRTSEEYEDA